MTIDPPDYGADSITKLDLPDAVQEAGVWRSMWRITATTHVEPERLASLAREVSARCPAEITLLQQDGEIAMELRARNHYLDVEGFPSIDCVLRMIDAALVIETINGSARDLWRTFRRP